MSLSSVWKRKNKCVVGIFHTLSCFKDTLRDLEIHFTLKAITRSGVFLHVSYEANTNNVNTLTTSNKKSETYIKELYFHFSSHVSVHVNNPYPPKKHIQTLQHRNDTFYQIGLRHVIHFKCYRLSYRIKKDLISLFIWSTCLVALL